MRYTPISELYRQVRERKLTPQEIEDREKIAKKLPMDDFKKRYGKDAMAVKMATATNIVKKKSAKSEVKEVLDPSIWFENWATVIVPLACVRPLFDAPTSA